MTDSGDISGEWRVASGWARPQLQTRVGGRDYPTMTIKGRQRGDSMVVRMAAALPDELALHPLQYAVAHDGVTFHTEDDPNRELGERYNRCPTCEQWSPCDVRRRPVVPSTGETTHWHAIRPSSQPSTRYTFAWYAS